ncbi:MAG: 4-hydroxy-tetrahydrodipicolinate synthase [Paramuribaculum sp.]|nr:4-hydroxy-tetrahydrodipicolinate synthase [Paramuribaculum sp.]
MASFRGLGVALITPFDNNGNIDFSSLENLIDYQIEGGVDYIVALGTTAETPALSADERHKVRRFVVDRVGGRVPLVAGCGGNSTSAILDELRNSDLDGFSGILSVVPYYNKPTQGGIHAHFAAIAEASPLPVILYNIPSRTGVNMLPETTLALASEFPGRVVAVKEASGNIGQINRIIADSPEGFEVISGDDSLTFPLICLGAAGVISVAANAVPAPMKQLVRLALEGDMAGAREVHRSLSEVFRLLFVDGNPAGVKAMLSCQGRIANVLRLPLVPASASTCEALSRLTVD